MLRYSEMFLVQYMRRHPDLFPDEVIRTAACPGRKESNGFPSEAAFQAAAVDLLQVLGWRVQETLKGSSRGGSVWTTPDWPDLTMFRSHRRMWFAELKQPGRRPTPEQAARHQELQAAGFTVVVAYDLQTLLEVERQLRETELVVQETLPDVEAEFRSEYSARRKDWTAPQAHVRPARPWLQEWTL